MSKRRAFIIAGELSGDRLGADLIQKLHAYGFKFTGIGGPAMTAAGLKSRFDMQALSLMGVMEILPSIPRLLRLIRQTADAIIANPPDVIITIDSPDFCLRVLKRVRKRLPQIKTVHYVAPSVWAWRPARAQKMARYVDHILALLPFEPPLMRAAGISCDFVGHPVIDEPMASDVQKADFIQKYHLDRNRPILVFLPGSRRAELKHLGAIYHATLCRLLKMQPDLQIITPLAHNVAPQVRQRFAGIDAITYIEPTQDWAQLQIEKRAAYALGRAALATSGTVGLELGAHACPMVMAFRANRLTEWMLKRLLTIDTANLINLINEDHAIAEYLVENCTADKLCAAVWQVLHDSKARQNQRDAMVRAMSRLGRAQCGRADWAAHSVLSFLKMEKLGA